MRPTKGKRIERRSEQLATEMEFIIIVVRLKFKLNNRTHCVKAIKLMEANLRGRRCAVCSTGGLLICLAKRKERIDVVIDDVGRG